MELRKRIEADMKTARLARGRETDLVLRSILQAFDNATALSGEAAIMRRYLA